MKLPPLILRECLQLFELGLHIVPVASLAGEEGIAGAVRLDPADNSPDLVEQQEQLLEGLHRPVGRP